MLSILNDSTYEKGLAMETIGELVPVNKVTLIHGRSGCGKTMSILKYLNTHNIEPVLIDFDTNDGIDEHVKLNHIDGFKFWDLFLNQYLNNDLREELIKQLSDKVFVIYTYAMANNYISVSSGKKYDVHSLCTFLLEAGSTVIVTAHTVYYSGKDAQPDVDNVWSNHIGCKLHLHKDILKTKTNYYLEVEKLRGYTGSDVINDWMR